MLIRLGFDLTGLVAGGAEAKAQLASIKAAADAANAAYVRANSQGRPLNALNQYMSTQPWKDAAVAASSGAAKIVAAQDAIAAASNRLNVSLGGLKVIAGTIALIGFVQFVHGAVSAATQFQTQMTLLQTQARATKGEVDSMTGAILQMAVGVQTGPEELAKGLYHIESVGIRSAKALEILTVAAEGARVGNADLESVTNAMVAAVTSGIKGVTNMSEAMGTLNGIVGSGNMRMQDLADSLRSGVLATATAFGVSLQQVGAALATMTDQGIPATEAATRLRITMALLGAPTRVAAEQLSRIGLSSTDLARDMRGEGGLIGAVKDLNAHMVASGFDAIQASQIYKAAFGGSRSSSGLLTLINTTELADAKLKIIGDTAKNFAETFRIQSETAAAKFAALGAAIGVLSVHFGNALLPVLTAAAAAMAFLAQQTAIVVPILVLITAAILRLAVVAFVRLVASLGLSTAYMVLGRIATILLAQGFAGLALSGEVAAVSVRSVGVAVLTALGPLNILLIALAAVAIAYVNVKAEADKAAAAFDQRIKDVAAQSKMQELIDERARLVQALKDTQKQEGGWSGINTFPSALGLSAQPAIQAGIATIDQAMADLQAHMKQGLVTTHGLVIDATQSLIDQLHTTMASVTDAIEMGLPQDLMAKYSKELLQNQEAPVAAMKQLTDTMKASLDPLAEIAQLKGMLASKKLSDGLASGIPAVRTAAEALRMIIGQRLFELDVNVNTAHVVAEISLLSAAQAKAAAYALTVRSFARNLQAEVEAGTTTAADAAKKITEKIGTSLKALKQVARVSGAETMIEYAKGLDSQWQNVLTVLKNLHEHIKTQMTKTAQIAFLLAALTSKDIVLGLASHNQATYAWAVGARETIIAQLKLLGVQTYAAGAAAGQNFANGLAHGFTVGGGLYAAILGSGNAKAIADLFKIGKPAMDAGTAAYEKWLKTLDTGAKHIGSTLGNTMAKAANSIAAAFNTIQSAAMKYFNKLHQLNMQAIEDHRKQVQAIVDSAQAGLDATSKAIELQNLLRAVREATDPAAQLAALQALHKFQAQQQIDAAQSALDKQIAAEKAAEDKRFSNQVAAFQKQLNSLERWLDKHPKLWREAQHKIIALLHSFGISYESAGNLLGVSFAKGLKKAILALLKALHILAGGKAPGVAGFGSGAYNLGEDQLAMVHKNEMIIPAGPAGAFRAWMSRAGGLGSLSGMAGGGAPSGGTIVFQIGDQVLAELSDRRLFVAKSIREPTDIAFGGSVR